MRSIYCDLVKKLPFFDYIHPFFMAKEKASTSRAHTIIEMENLRHKKKPPLKLKQKKPKNTVKMKNAWVKERAQLNVKKQTRALPSHDPRKLDSAWHNQRVPFKNDPMAFIIKTSLDLYKYKVVRIITDLVFVFHLIFLVCHIYYSFAVFAMDKFFSFAWNMAGATVGELSVILYIAERKKLYALLSFLKDTSHEWTCASKKLQKRIRLDIIYYKVYLVTFSLLFLMLLIVHHPIFGDEIYFSAWFLRRRLPGYEIAIMQLYCVAFGLILFYVGAYPYILLYLGYYVKYQLYMLNELVEQLTLEHTDRDIIELIEDEEYQQQVFYRLRYVIMRHCDLLKLYHKIDETIAMGFFCRIIFAALLMISLTSTLLHTRFTTILLARVVFSDLTIFIMLILVSNIGQEIYDVGDDMIRSATGLPFDTWNRKNKNTYLLFLTNIKPLLVRVPGMATLDYSLLISVVRVLYSTAALLQRTSHRE